MTRRFSIGLYHLLMLAYLCAVSLLCFAQLGAPPSQGLIWGIPSDKIAHFLLFIPFPFLAWGCTQRQKETVPNILSKLAIIFLLGFALGFLTEYIQGFLPGRCRERLDFLADMCGITASCLAIVIFKLCRQKES